MIHLFTHVFLNWILFLSQHQALEIITFIDNTDKHFTVFTSNQMAQSFLYTPKSCCQLSKLYHEYSTNSITNFTILTNNDSDKEFNPKKMAANIINNNHYTLVPIDTYYTNHPNIIQMQLFNVCSIKSNYSSDLTSLVEITFESNDNIYRFNYIKICKYQSSLLIRFTLLLLLIILFAIVVLLISRLSIDTALFTKHRGIIYLEWWYGVILLIIGIATVIFVYFFNQLGSKIISLFVILLLFGVLYKASVSFFKIVFHARPISIKVKEFITKKTFNLKRYRIISVIISICLVIPWVIYHNWILGNILVFLFVFAVNQSISFNNFPNLLLFVCCLMSYDIYWFLTQFYFKGFYNIKALEAIDQPIKLILPKFIERNMVHPCYFISFVDIVIVNELIAYSKCFDVVKGNLLKPFYKTSLVQFSIGSMIVILIQLYLDNDQIHLFPIQMILISGLIIKASITNDFLNFWNGLDMQGMQKVVDEIISNEIITSKVSENKGITNNDCIEYENTIKYDNNSQ